MTKEEAIENIKLIRFNAAITNANSFKEALDMAIKALSQPSLPSDLEEAADAHIRRVANAGRDWTTQDIAEAFKAGAEWTAGLGVNADFWVCKLRGRAWLTPIDEKRFMQDVFGNFAVGDKVIVQIRKKQ